MAGAFLGTGAIEHEHTTMVGGRAKNDIARHLRIGGDQRAHQRALAEARQLHRFLDRVIRHDRVHRAKGLDVVRLEPRERLIAHHQHR